MPKKEFNDKGGLKKFYETLGVEPPVLSEDENRGLQRALDRLKEARANDPDFDRKAIEAWVEAEVNFGKDDPAEGKIVITKHKAPKRSK